MMFPCNLHTHSLFCDGESTLEEMVQAAIEAGLEVVGLSGHGPAEYDTAAMAENRAMDYITEGRRLKAKYKSQIEVCVGMEIDGHSSFDKSLLDYCIGSVHYIADDSGHKHSVDHSEARFRQTIDALDGARSMVCRYCDTVEMMLDTIRPDIIGHLDIVGKLNRNGKFFDQNTDWYMDSLRRLARMAADSGCIVEVNTAGYAARGEQYPANPLLELLLEQNVPLTMTADAHSTGRICADFDRAAILLKKIGFTRLHMLKNGRFIPWEL